MATRGVPVYVVHSPTKLADGKVYEYVYLRYEVWDGSKKRMQPKPLAALGRADRLDEGRVESLGSFLKDWLRKESALPFDALRERFKEAEPAMRILCSREFGLRVLIEQAWSELGYADAVAEIAKKRAGRERIEMAIFAMVLVQLVAPTSKRGIAKWSGADLFFPEGAHLELRDLYSAMDVLEAGYATVELRLNERLRHLGAAPLELVQDTTTISHAIRYDDEERAEIEAHRQARGEAQRRAVVNEPPLRMRGKSKSKRDDLPQIVLDAVMGENRMIVHHETVPGNTSDKTRVEPAVTALQRLGYKRVRYASDANFNSVENRGVLRDAKFEFVSAEGVARTKVVQKVLKTAGRYQQHPDKPEISFKCVRAEPTEERPHPSGPPAPDRLYIIRRNEEEEAFTHYRIDRHVAHIEAVLAKGGSDVEKLLSDPTLRKYVKRDARTKTRRGKAAGPVILNRKTIAGMKHLAGKSVIAVDCLDAHPLAEDDLYRNLFDLEAIFRQLKDTLEVGPVRHRLAGRIEAHVMIAVMASNVGRWLSMKAGMTLERLQLLMRNLRVQKVEMGEAIYWERVELEAEQEEVFRRMGYDLPPKRFTVAFRDRATTQHRVRS